MFRLNLAGVRDQPGKPVIFNFREQLAPVEGPDEIVAFIGPVEAEVNVTYMEGQYWFNGSVRGRVELMCARCLEPFEYPFQVTLAEKYGRGWCQDDAETAPHGG